MPDGKPHISVIWRDDIGISNLINDQHGISFPDIRATAMTLAFLDTFEELPPRHAPATFSVDQNVMKLEDSLAAD
jgi:hypothetical protein